MQSNTGMSTTKYTLAPGMEPKVCADEFIFSYLTCALSD